MGRLLILGSGTSTGVPEIGCTCPVCTSSDARDRRLRTSALVQVDDVNILIDCGPDFREQMLRASFFGRIDAVLLTHEHYDHVVGLDDLRPYCRLGEIPLYANALTAAHLQQRMPYCFVEKKYPGIPRLRLVTVEPGVGFSVGGVDIRPFTVMHGRLPVLGFRIGSHLGYITDMSEMTAEAYEALEGVSLLVMNALRPQTHPTHQSFGEAMEVAGRIGAEATYFVHMSHHAGLHGEIAALTPSRHYFAYDGLSIDF